MCEPHKERCRHGASVRRKMSETAARDSMWRMENVPAVQATLETTSQWKSMTKTSVATYFRDEQSRTRVEHGDMASIHDPATGQCFLLNPAKKIAIPGAPKIPSMSVPGAPKLPGVPQLPGAPQAPGAPQLPGASTPQMTETGSLGEKTIDGMKVSGKQFSASIPGKPQALAGETWTSKDLKLPIQTTVTDPSTGAVTKTQLKNIQPGVKLDPGMFKVPPGFKITAPATPAPSLPK